MDIKYTVKDTRGQVNKWKKGNCKIKLRYLKSFQ